MAEARGTDPVVGPAAVGAADVPGATSDPVTEGASRATSDPVAEGASRATSDPVAEGASRATSDPVTPGASADELIGLIDRLEGLLRTSELAEMEIEVGDLAIVLRTPAALASGPAVLVPTSPDAGSPTDPATGHPTRTGSTAAASAGAAGAAGQAGGTASSAGTGGMQAGGHVGPGQAEPEAGPQTHLVLAPLTGIYYSAPSPGAEAYVHVGDQVANGQVIGLIEAMKLFNEIKSDAGGRVVRLHADNGKLVKARQPLLEIEPL